MQYCGICAWNNKVRWKNKLTLSPLNFVTNRLCSMSHLLPRIIRSTPSLACWETKSKIELKLRFYICASFWSFLFRAGLSNTWPSILSNVPQAEVKVWQLYCIYLGCKGQIDILIRKRWPPFYDLNLKAALLEKGLSNPALERFHCQQYLRTEKAKETFCSYASGMWTNVWRVVLDLAFRYVNCQH